MRNLIPTLTPLLQGFAGLQQASTGAEMTILGAVQQERQYQLAGASTLAAANYNRALSRLNFNRQQDQLAKEIQSFMSTQRAQFSGTGFAAGSQSFLDITNSTLNTFEQSVLDAIHSQGLEEQGILFEAQSRAVALENQGKAARFQGQVSAFQQEQAASKQFGGLLGEAFTSISGAF